MKENQLTAQERYFDESELRDFFPFVFFIKFIPSTKYVACHTLIAPVV
jgi:hypothetical protein